ncbi:MAG: ATP-binding protein [Rhodobacteraceae bacterium]|nr:ATP-binding protein [Paracoccaceae bacterium]
MDPRHNPYTPGAGTQPLELAGREAIVEQAKITLDRIKLGRPGRSVMLLGLRGVGKTVLLNHIFNLAEERGFFTVRMEAPESGELAARSYPDLKRILIRLSARHNIRDKVARAGSAMRNFASIFKVSFEGFELGATPGDGVADTGDLERDYAEVLRAVIEAAKAAEQPLAFFVDEIQYLQPKELAALTLACHEAAQRGLPFVLYGAGLPQIAKLAGDAKSYAERLFEFPPVGALTDEAARRAIMGPALAEGVTYTDDAVDEILAQTLNYPYFLQEWGSTIWNYADASPISLGDVTGARDSIIARLDASFFRVRFDRCKPVQQKYLRAMAELGAGPHQTGAIATALGCEASQLATTRAQLISLGMIWSQRHGETAFTVPLFDKFMLRAIPVLEKHVPQRRARR